MKKINKEFIIKNLMGIFAGGMILSFLFPFISVGTEISVMGISESGDISTVNGLEIITLGGVWGTLLLLAPIAILVASYVPQLRKYKKIICPIASVISFIMVFLVSRSCAAVAAGISGGNEYASVDFDVNHKLGFWLFLIFSVLLVAMSVIQFFGLKGNKVFDTVNSMNEQNEGQIEFNSQVAKGFAQNVMGKVQNNMQQTAGKPFTPTTANTQANQPVYNQSVQQAPTPINTQAAYTQYIAPQGAAQQIPVQQAPARQAPAQQIPVQQTPARQAPAQQIPVQQAPVRQAPAQQIPVQQTPVRQAPAQQIPVQQAPARQAVYTQATAPAVTSCCPNCKTPVAQNVKFCPSCGTSLSGKRECPNCHVEIADGTKFCPSCGTPV